MGNKIITSASRNGKSITVNWSMINEKMEELENGQMGIDLVHTNALDYSHSPPIPYTQEQRIQIIVSQVVDSLKRQLHLNDAGEVDGDIAVSALDGLEVLP